MKKFFLLVVLLIVFATKFSVAQTYSQSIPAPAEMLLSPVGGNVNGMFYIEANLTSPPSTPGVYVSYIAVYFEATGYNPADNIQDISEVFDNMDGNPSPDLVYYNFNPSLYSSQRMEWYVLYSDNTWEDYVLEY